MPSLTWSSKQKSPPPSSSLTIDSIIYPGGQGYPAGVPQNRLVLGDNLSVMSALLATHENKIDLVYIDPPFFTNRKFSARIGRGEDSRKPEEWVLGEGYEDSWQTLDSYLDFLYQRLTLIHRLLAPNGSLYLHLDWHANSYARILLDEIFGSENFLNEIIWTYHGPSPIRRAFNRKHDSILLYVKGSDYTFNADAVRAPYHPSTVQTFRSSRKAGFGKVPNLARGKVPEDWWYFPVTARLHNQRTGYPTQKPESLLQRIILASSNPGDLVADFFCGSGTTPSVAARNGRHFIASDIALRAVQTTRQRLSALPIDAFTLERDSAIHIPYLNAANLRCEILRDSIKINTRLSLDYWEVDPAWTGGIFNSAAQAQRPIRSGSIANELRIKTGRNSCVRMVTIEGKLYQKELNV